MLQKKTGFTLIELLIVVAIIGILASVILVSMAEKGRKARVASAVSSLRSALPVIVACYEGGGIVNSPNMVAPQGNNAICGVDMSAVWPTTQWGWAYNIIGVLGGNFNTTSCVFEIVPPAGDSSPIITCRCLEQACR